MVAGWYYFGGVPLKWVRISLLLNLGSVRRRNEIAVRIIPFRDKDVIWRRRLRMGSTGWILPVGV
jgi:hypothetical protein